MDLLLMKGKLQSIAGFTLMEINLVLFLFGAGVTAILGIFPVGLRQAQYAFSDTVQVSFATKVLAQLESNAEEMCRPKEGGSTDLRAKWKTLGAFRNAVLDNVTVNDGEIQIKDTSGTEYEKKGILIKDYLSEGAPIRYCLEIIQLEYDENKGMLPYLYRDGVTKPPPRYRAALWVIDMKNGKPKTTKPYIADFQYYERIPGESSGQEGN